jgi:hypothetical protein
MDERDRKLRHVEAAAASAVLNGCDPDEVRTRVEQGIAEALYLNERSAQMRAAADRARERDRQPPHRSPLDEWAVNVGS